MAADIRLRRWSSTDDSWCGVAWTVTGGLILESDRETGGSVAHASCHPEAPSADTVASPAFILKAEMRLLYRLALRVGWALARHPETRAKAAQAFGTTKRVINNDLKPRAQRVRQEARLEIERARQGLTRVAKELRDEYHKRRDGS